ncbi:unnamed protein product [Ilex paraguariensis]|uniref:CWF19-like protein 2 n=1 Tax=Ilex paraguariensis TaxID=185542 RepID=A0ABC8US38_9AQUA
MLSGLKFIPRDQIDKAQEKNVNDSSRERKKSGSKKRKDRRKKKSSRCHSSDDELEKIKKGSRRKNKWYTSDDELSSNSSESESGSDSDRDKKKRRGKKKEKKDKERDGEKNDVEEDLHENGGGLDSINIVRKEMGLEWMFRPTEKITTSPNHQPEKTQAEEIKKENPRELNPYLKDNGSGYPEESAETKAVGTQLLSSSVVGDGGASWRLKALKRSQEQAAREGRRLGDVVEERWGSLSQLAVPVASHRAAPSHAHLHAIKNRRRGLTDGQTINANQNEMASEKSTDQEQPLDFPLRHPKMRVPKLDESLTWGKRKGQSMSTKDAGLISSALSSLNKFANDGSFMREVMHQHTNDSDASVGSSFTNYDRDVKSELVSLESEKLSEDGAVVKPALSANQLAAKVLQLRMKGKHEEAEKLLKEADNIKVKAGAGEESIRVRNAGTSSRHFMHDISLRQKKKDEDADMHLAQKIVRNQQYSISGRADDEYDYEEGPSRKTRKKLRGDDHKSAERSNLGKRILTQQERCQFCFENPARPMHLVVAIANFTYLSLPQLQPIVPGHCCILPMQHESSTRTVDNNVWDEIRNFKKCLIMMFAKQEKDLVFLETVMGLAQQRRHCLVDCIPLPREIAKQAPLYFKKAIDEAEDEWSQHNAKKLIDTSEKGLRSSIPKDFPYFHVEFGLNKGFVHVIDDESQFKSHLGLNVIRGMLRLPAEDMHRRRKHESVEAQKQAVASFAQDWEPFDWTKQL